MSVNSSSNSSLQSSFYFCNTKSISIFTALFIIYILLLPLFILILHIGYKRWKVQRSVARAAMTSHSDIFTFNIVVVELIAVLACFFYSFGSYSKHEGIILLGMYIFYLWSHGQTLFHLLTCVERYLAVVHPITYLQLRQRGGVRIRNISIVCVWLLCFGIVCVSVLRYDFYSISSFLILGFSCLGVSFCSLSVLCVLIRPGPGKGGGNREQSDQSKLRAFQIIMAIMGALLLRFLSLLVNNAIYFTSDLSTNEMCLMGISALWFSLPSSLVLPLLFLHRAGKLPGCKHNTESS